VATSLLVTAAALAGCSGGSGDGACGPVERPRAQFPATHVLRGQPEPSYLSEPPTSGPHLPAVDVPTDVLTPLSRPQQVGLLELGVVLVQYRPDDLGAGQVDELRALGGPLVVVAPNPDLPAPVAASAWLALQLCDAPDAGALASFAEDHADDAPGGHLDD
jgi:hypothetical protein